MAPLLSAFRVIFRINSLRFATPRMPAMPMCIYSRTIRLVIPQYYNGCIAPDVSCVPVRRPLPLINPWPIITMSFTTKVRRHSRRWDNSPLSYRIWLNITRSCNSAKWYVKQQEKRSVRHGNRITETPEILTEGPRVSPRTGWYRSQEMSPMVTGVLPPVVIGLISPVRLPTSPR